MRLERGAAIEIRERAAKTELFQDQFVLGLGQAALGPACLRGAIIVGTPAMSSQCSRSGRDSTQERNASIDNGAETPAMPFSR